MVPRKLLLTAGIVGWPKLGVELKPNPVVLDAPEAGFCPNIEDPIKARQKNIKETTKTGKSNTTAYVALNR